MLLCLNKVRAVGHTSPLYCLLSIWVDWKHGIHKRKRQDVTCASAWWLGPVFAASWTYSHVLELPVIISCPLEDNCNFFHLWSICLGHATNIEGRSTNVPLNQKLKTSDYDYILSCISMYSPTTIVYTYNKCTSLWFTLALPRAIFTKASPAAINCVQVASRAQPHVIRWPGGSDCTPIGINNSSIVA